MNSEIFQHRVAVIGAIVVFLLSVVALRLLYLEVLTGNEYLAIAKDNKIREVAIDAPRGTIYDRSGNVLVGNRNGLSVALNMTQIEMGGEDQKDVDATIKRLSSLLAMPVSDIKKRMKNPKISPYRPVPIKDDVSMDIATYIKEHQLDFPNVVIIGVPVRDYPNGSAGAHVLGYLGEISDKELKQSEFKEYKPGDTVGRGGVEQEYEQKLAGKKGQERLEVNAAGYPISTLITRRPVAGDDLYLTINTDLQNLTQSLLEEALVEARQAYDAGSKKNYNAPAGAAVVMNPNNGEILAMASAPGYDPRWFTNGMSTSLWQQLNDPNNHYPLNNRAMGNSFPPGSTFKVVTATAAMNEGIASADSTFNCTGKWTGAGADWPQWCWDTSGHGHVSLEEGIVQSCDTVFYELGYDFYKQIGNKGEKMQDWAKQYGLGALTGVDIPGEDAGRIPTKAWKKRWNKNDPELQTWYPGDSTNFAIGQGDILATPLQMAVVYSAVANGGTVYKPHVVRKIESSDKSVLLNVKGEKVRSLKTTPDILAIIRGDLEDVVKRGTGSSAFEGFPLSSIPVAGKTGSAEMYGRQASAWFAAYAPADKPQYVVIVTIEEGGHGVTAAAPVARKIFDGIFGLSSSAGIRIESAGD